MTSKQFTPDLKLKAVNYYHKIKNYVKVCEIFECSERSLKRWVERYNKNPCLNSIEQFFNQMKHYMKLDKPNTFIAFDESVQISIDKTYQSHKYIKLSLTSPTTYQSEGRLYQ